MAKTWLVFEERAKYPFIQLGVNQRYVNNPASGMPYIHMNQIEDYSSTVGNPEIPGYTILSSAYQNYLPVKFIVETEINFVSSELQLFPSGKYLIASDLGINTTSPPAWGAISSIGNSAQFLEQVMRRSSDFVKVHVVTVNNSEQAALKTFRFRRQFSLKQISQNMYQDWWTTGGYSSASSVNPATVLNCVYMVSSLDAIDPGGYMMVHHRVFAKVLWKDRDDNPGI